MPLHLQPIVFDAFKYFPPHTVSFLNSMERDEVEYTFQFFTYENKTVPDLDNIFVYNNSEDTIGLHNFWYSNLYSQVTKWLNTLVTVNMMAPLNYIIRDIDAYDIENTKFFISYSVFTLAYINTIDSILNTDYTQKGENIFEIGFSLIESCRLINDNYYNYYKDWYLGRFVDIYKAIFKPLSFSFLDNNKIDKSKRDLTFKRFFVDNSIHIKESRFLLNAREAISCNKEYIPQTLKELWVNTWIDNCNESFMNYVENSEVLADHTIKLYDTNWGSRNIASIVENALLDSLWALYYRGLNREEDGIIFIEDVYATYLESQADTEVAIKYSGECLLIKIMLLYLLTIPVEERRYNKDYEIQNRYMEMNLGL